MTRNSSEISDVRVGVCLFGDRLLMCDVDSLSPYEQSRPEK